MNIYISAFAFSFNFFPSWNACCSKIWCFRQLCPLLLLYRMYYSFCWLWVESLREHIIDAKQFLFAFLNLFQLLQILLIGLIKLLTLHRCCSLLIPWGFDWHKFLWDAWCLGNIIVIGGILIDLISNWNVHQLFIFLHVLLHLSNKLLLHLIKFFEGLAQSCSFVWILAKLRLDFNVHFRLFWLCMWAIINMQFI